MSLYLLFDLQMDNTQEMFTTYIFSMFSQKLDKVVSVNEYLQKRIISWSIPIEYIQVHKGRADAK